MIIADITRAWVGSESNLIQNAITRSVVARTTLTLVFHETQSSRISFPSDVRAFPVNAFFTGDQIAAAIRESIVLPTLSESATEHIEILSFHVPVLNMAITLPSHVGCRITVVHLKTIGTTPAQYPPPVVFSNEILDQAAYILVQALQPFPRGLPQTGLRDVVVGISPTLDKKHGGPPIGQIVRHAHGKGLVDVTPLGHVNPLVRLASVRPENENAQPANRTEDNATTSETAAAPRGACRG